MDGLVVGWMDGCTYCIRGDADAVDRDAPKDPRRAGFKACLLSETKVAMNRN